MAPASVVAQQGQVAMSANIVSRSAGVSSRWQETVNAAALNNRSSSSVFGVKIEASARPEGESTRRWKTELGVAKSTTTESILDEPETVVGTPLDSEGRGKGADHPYATMHIGERWREIQGSKDWAGLLDPLDPVLKSEILRYGEFAQVTYDSFDNDTHSHYCGSCLYSKKHLLEKVGLENRGYTITDYLYSTSSGKGSPIAKFFKFIDIDDEDDFDANDLWSTDTNFMGYVAVATDEKEIKRLGRRDILIVWRGTVTQLEWLENLRSTLAPAAFDFEAGIGGGELKVESGYLNVYSNHKTESPFGKHSARYQVHMAVRHLVNQYKDEPLSITVTGHSLGGALALICGFDMAENDHFHRPKGSRYEAETVPVMVVSFAAPRVGNDAFRDRVNELGVKVLRVVNKHDRVPKAPGLFLNENMDTLETKAPWLYNIMENLPFTYTHVGVLLELDSLKSPYLRRTTDIMNTHNLEAHLHIVNGFTSKDGPFQPAFKRDLALVNKGCDFIKFSHQIPVRWWQKEHKGLHFQNGSWIVRHRSLDDIPVPEDHDEDGPIDLKRNPSKKGYLSS